MLLPLLLLVSMGLQSAAEPPPQAAPSSPKRSATATMSADETELRKLNDEWLDAYPKRAVTTLDRILSDDFMTIIAGGPALTKAELLRSVADPKRVVSDMKWSNVRVHIRGDVAVVTGRSALIGSLNGRDISGSNEYADVYVKRDGKWRAIAAHVVRVAAP